MRTRLALLAVLVALTTALPAAPAHAEDGGGIRGRVTNDAGQPLEGIFVSLWRFLPHLVGSGNDHDGADDGWVPVYNYTETSADGTYSLHELPQGLYTLEFYDAGADAVYAGEWFGEAVEFAGATPFYVVRDGVSIGKDAVLSRGARVTGRITADHAMSDWRARAILFRRSSDGTYERWVAAFPFHDGAVEPFSAGFAFSLLPPGTYRLSVDDQDGLDTDLVGAEYWNDKPTAASADDLVVEIGSTLTGLDIQLTAAGPPPAIENTGLPTVSGIARVGNPLSATSGSWDPAPSSVGYQWFVAGSPVPGATSATFVPRPTDLGKPIVVSATAASPELSPTTSASAATLPLAPGVMRLRGAPSLAGKPVVGKRLTVRLQTVPRGATYRYRWFVGGKHVKKWDDRRRVRVRDKDAGRRIVVKVAAAVPGYVTLTRRLGPTGRVSSGL